MPKNEQNAETLKPKFSQLPSEKEELTKKGEETGPGYGEFYPAMHEAEMDTATEKLTQKRLEEEINVAETQIAALENITNDFSDWDEDIVNKELDAINHRLVELDKIESNEKIDSLKSQLKEYKNKIENNFKLKEAA